MRPLPPEAQILPEVSTAMPYPPEYPPPLKPELPDTGEPEELNSLMSVAPEFKSQTLGQQWQPARRESASADRKRRAFAGQRTDGARRARSILSTRVINAMVE